MSSRTQYTKESLQKKKVLTLRRLCVQLDIVGCNKAKGYIQKSDIIQLILKHQEVGVSKKILTPLKQKVAIVKAKVYTPLIIFDTTISLGVFDTRKDAEKVFLKYIKQNPGFAKWLNTKKIEYKKEYNKKLIFDHSIFSEDDYGFWEEELPFIIVEAEVGTLFDFYQWTKWVEDYEMKNLYTLLNSILKNTRFIVDIDDIALDYPIIR